MKALIIGFYVNLVSVFITLMCVGFYAAHATYEDYELGLRQIKADRAAAESVLDGYLADKYGMDQQDYHVESLVPWTHDLDMFSTNHTQAYYSGQWQARVHAGQEAFYVRVTARDNGARSIDCDSLQSDEYLTELAQWVRGALDLPQDCDVDISVDPDKVDPFTPGHRWYEYLLPYDVQPALAGYYDGDDILSPVTDSLMIRISYPKTYDSGDFASDDEVRRAFAGTDYMGLTVVIAQEQQTGAGNYRTETTLQGDAPGGAEG